MKQLHALLHENPWKHRALWSVIVLSVFFLFLFFGSEDDYKKNPFNKKVNSYLKGLKVVNKNGSNSLIITAEKAEFTQDETTVNMDSIVIEMTAEGITLNADRGTYNLNTRDLRLEDDVKIKTKDYVVFAKGLSWNPYSERLTSENKIRVEGGNFKIEGEGLNTTEGQKVRLMKNVKASFF